DGSVSYRASHKAHHHHIVCVSCGATEDVHLNDVEDVLTGVRGATDYDIVGHRIEVYGLCPACKARQTARPVPQIPQLSPRPQSVPDPDCLAVRLEPHRAVRVRPK